MTRTMRIGDGVGAMREVDRALQVSMYMYMYIS